MKKSRAIELLEHLAWDRDIERNPYGDALNMAIEALKAQLSQEGTTSDMVSRQAAIDELPYLLDYDGLKGENGFVSKRLVRKMLKELPPVQPEPQEGHWIWVAGELMCSECRTIYSDLYPDYDNAVACPHCGAKMKGAQNG